MGVYWPKSIENRAAIRTAIAALVAILISFSLHLETPYWSGMTVVVVANLYTGSIIDKAMMRILGTIAGAFIGFYLAGLVANSFLLYCLSCFVVITWSAYYYHLSQYGYAYLLGALCVFLVIAQLAINPHGAFFVAIWRPVEIGIGVVVSAISAYSIFPNHIKDLMSTQINAIFTDFSEELKGLFLQINEQNTLFYALRDRNLEMKRKIKKTIDWLGAMRREVGIKQERIDELRVFLELLYDFSRQMQYLMITAPKEQELLFLSAFSLEPIFNAIQRDLIEIKTAFIQQTEITNTLQSILAIAQLKNRWNHALDKIADESDFIFSFFHYLDQLSVSMQTMNAFLSKQLPPLDSKCQWITRQDRLHGDLDLVKQSIKAGLAVVVSLGFWMLSHWPGGINGIISSLIISVRKSLFDMKNISVHRVLGCFLGGGVALLSLCVVEMNGYDFCFIILFFVWIFSYLMFKWPRYAYCGLQANIALIISLAQQGGPPVALDPPLERLGGIFIGIGASFIVANMIWRFDALTVLNRYLNKLYGYLFFNMTQWFSFFEGQVVWHDLASLFWNARELIEALAKAQLKPGKQKKLLDLSQRFEELVMIQAILSHIKSTVDREQAFVVAHGLEIDLHDLEQSVLKLYQAPRSQVDWAKKMEEVDLKIKQNRPIKIIEHDALRHFLAYLNALKQLISLRFNLFRGDYHA